MNRFRRVASVAFFAMLTSAGVALPDVISDAPSHWAGGPTGRIHYKSWGSGKDALVFVHGWTCDMSYFAGQVPHFANRMHVIAIDLPGHGASDKPEIEYTQSVFADAIRRVLDDAHVRRAVLVGHSMGMPVSRQFYRLYPKRTAGIVSLDGSVKAMITSQKTIDMVMANLHGPAYQATAAQMIDGMLAAAPDTPYKTHIREVMLATPQHVVASTAAGMFDLSLWNDDPIRVPMLLIHARTPMWTPEYEAYAHKLAPNLDYVVLDGVSHFLHTEKPAEVNALIDAFLAKNKLLVQQ